MNLKKHIPNVLTLINLLSGCILVYTTLYYSFNDFKDVNEFTTAITIFLSISLVADFLDGLVARWLNVSSPIGLQLDSLADMVTFGVFPGFLMAFMIRMVHDSTLIPFPIIAFFGLLITLFSALRLAKFNVDTTQITYFKGLATPANTIMIFGIFLVFFDLPSNFITTNGLNSLIAVTVISSFLLISDIPLFSFKVKSFTLKNVLPQLILVVVAIILFIFFGLKALAPIILVYIILSIILRKTFAHA